VKALITASFSAAGLQRLGRHMEVVHEDWRQKQQIYFDGAKFAERIAAVGADVLIIEADLVHEEVLDRCPLKLIGCCRGDPINVGIARATELGIPVLFAPGRNADAVADLTLAFLLALARNVYTVNALLKSGQMTFTGAKDYLSAYERYGGFELGGVTVGVVGFGAIGRRVVARLRAFGSNVLVYDPFVDPAAVRAAGAELSDLDALVRASDVLTLHCPDTPENRHLISAERIRSMKPGSYLLNLARAALVDDDALYAALRDGHLAGAALDVFADEPVRPENRFVQLPNVLVSPHLGGATRDVIGHQTDMIVDGIEAWLAGRRPELIVNPQVLSEAARR
jgi:D-3-phosphoglycerate dehydrogenase / 2-oxoglutarate reductase